MVHVMSEVQKSEPFVYWADCADPDQSAMCWHKEDALTQINDHGGTLYELSHTSELDAQRLRADTAEAELAECKRKHLRSCQIAIGKSQLAKERHAQLIEAEEIRASWQNGYDVKCQNILLLTLANRELRTLLQRVIDSSVLSFEADAPEELESLEVDICSALSTASPATIKPVASSHPGCDRCGCSTVEHCDEIGCGFLGSGNGEPATINQQGEEA